MIMCVLLCYPVSIHMSQLLSTGRPISSLILRNVLLCFLSNLIYIKSTALQAQYLPHKGELSVLIKQNHYHRVPTAN